MKFSKTLVIGLFMAALLSNPINLSARSHFFERKYFSFAYETDGHYWTVLVVATLLQIPDADAIAYAAEFPDNVMNDYGYVVRSRFTYLYPGAQKKVHALTGGNPEYERLISCNLFKTAISVNQKGIACHRLGDSYAHTNDKTGRMYPHLIAHLFHWKKPDKIRNAPNKYLSYVNDLVKNLGGQHAEIDMDVFNYIARAGLDSDENAAILKAEYNRLKGSIAFSINKDELDVVEDYLSAKMSADSFAVHSNADDKGNETTTIIFVKN